MVGLSGGFLGVVLGWRPRAGSPSLVSRLLSGHTHSHVALSPGTVFQQGWPASEPSLLWKELGAGTRQRLSHICLQTSACGEMRVWGRGGEGTVRGYFS